MFISLGLGQYNLSLYHLANHACFKALLFIGAGAVIHSFIDQQDIRKFGGLTNIVPVIYSSILLGSFSLIALPYMTGWYSKDGILEITIGNVGITSGFIFVIGSIVAGITAFYSMRLIYLTFIVIPNSPYNYYKNSHDANFLVIFPLFFLSIFSVCLGYITSDIYRGLGSDFLSVSTPLKSSIVYTIDAEFGTYTIFKLIPLIFTIIGIIISYYFFITKKGQNTIKNIINNNIIKYIYKFFNFQWNFDAWVNHFIIIKGLKLGHNISKVIDRGILEYVGPYGIYKGSISTGNNFSKFSTGIFTDYAIYIVISILIFVSLIMYPIISYGISPVENIVNMNFIILIIINIFTCFIIIPYKKS